MKNKDKPDIRFDGFNENFKAYNLGDIVEVLDGDRGKEYPSGNELSVIGHTVFLNANNITRNGFSLDKLQYITEQKSNLMGNGKVKLEDTILTSRGSVGNIAYYNNDINKKIPHARINSGMLILRPSKTIHSGYIAQYLNSSIGKKQIKLQAFGSAQPQLTKRDVTNITVSIPELTEQKKITNLVETLDNIIVLQQQELTILKQTKQGFLQKMFPKEGEKVPEVRFPGFTDNWKSLKLSDVATFINGRAYKQQELLESGMYKVLRVGNFYTNNKWYYSDLELEDKFYADKGDLLYTWSASFGPHIWQGDKVIYHYHIWKVELKSGLDKQFAVQLLEYDKAKILNGSNGSTMIHLTKKGMEEKKFSLPSIEEQVEIGSFFKKIDEVIALHEQELEALQQTKKAFLQKMFV
ncbi:restriction endonuclease subunit S [Sporosarcina sp. P16b]|uniref:restriction endonuclease subunit S n=1 Tax=Sporosarcina sp. P16b TaxID=2048261 RepID=UPI000C16CFFC|nr:restriction endonuclease subunit S [Sporosarcina sp. P16b]PIC69066.1 restriction endonuclease subunit S [Sporosarcina sp. P16b]